VWGGRLGFRTGIIPARVALLRYGCDLDATRQLCLYSSTLGWPGAGVNGTMKIEIGRSGEIADTKCVRAGCKNLRALTLSREFPRHNL
jgi:hypothetical protein